LNEQKREKSYFFIFDLALRWTWEKYTWWTDMKGGTLFFLFPTCIYFEGWGAGNII
jgi:hypothetical protein